MSITILQRSSKGMRSIKLQNRYLYLLSTLALVIPLASAFGGYYFATKRIEMAQVEQTIVDSWRDEVEQQWKALDEAKKTSQQQLNALTAKVGLLQAHVTRLDAAGERVITLSGLDPAEFNFSQSPALGGPEEASASQVADVPQLLDSLNAIDSQLLSREQQLTVLESLLLDKHMGVERFISGRPINKGWMSSFYGERADPFSGKPAWHGGIDFAGTEGESVLATAAGVVSWVGDRYGYGNLIEINHGDGMLTRYGHNKDILVEKGDVVRKGQVIARMGNTGRSTGAHVHYEIIKNGRTLNPLPYVERKVKG